MIPHDPKYLLLWKLWYYSRATTFHNISSWFLVGDMGIYWGFGFSLSREYGKLLFRDYVAIRNAYSLLRASKILNKK